MVVMVARSAKGSVRCCSMGFGVVVSDGCDSSDDGGGSPGGSQCSGCDGSSGIKLPA